MGELAQHRTDQTVQKNFTTPLSRASN